MYTAYKVVYMAEMVMYMHKVVYIAELVVYTHLFIFTEDEVTFDSRNKSKITSSVREAISSLI